MKPYLSFIIVFLTVIAISVFVGADSLASSAWYKYRLPRVAILLDRSDANMVMSIGNYYFNSAVGGGEYNPDLAEKAYKKAVSINPNILWGHYQLARIYFVMGDYDLALDEIAKELEANPENLRSLYIRGLIYGYRLLPGDLERAEDDFRHFTQWAPLEWAGYNDLAWILSKSGKYYEAKSVVEEAMHKASGAENNPWLWNAKGLAELNIGEYSLAMSSFEKALRLSEDLTETDWRKNYPGNDPVSSQSGLTAFKQAIEKNLKKAQDLARG